MPLNNYHLFCNGLACYHTKKYGYISDQVCSCINNPKGLTMILGVLFKLLKMTANFFHPLHVPAYLQASWLYCCRYKRDFCKNQIHKRSVLLSRYQRKMYGMAEQMNCYLYYLYIILSVLPVLGRESKCELYVGI